MGNQGQMLQGEKEWSGFGSAVSLYNNGSEIAIGSPYFSSNNNGEGKVDFYRFSNNDWVNLNISLNGAINNENFGSSISTSLNVENILIYS